MDVTSRANTTTDAALAIHSTVPGEINTSLGGVGRNIAEAAHRILSSQSHGQQPVLVSPIGDDFFGHTLAEQIERLGMRSDGLRKVESARSAICNMVLDGKGELISGVADMGIIEAFPGWRLSFRYSSFGDAKLWIGNRQWKLSSCTGLQSSQ